MKYCDRADDARLSDYHSAQTYYIQARTGSRYKTDCVVGARSHRPFSGRSPRCPRLQIIERFKAKLRQRRRPAWPAMDEVRFSPALSVGGSAGLLLCLLLPASTESSIRFDTRGHSLLFVHVVLAGGPPKATSMSRMCGALQVQEHSNIRACEHRVYSHCTRVITIPGNTHGHVHKTSHEPTPETLTQRVLTRADCTCVHERGTIEALGFAFVDIAPVMTSELVKVWGSAPRNG